MKKKSLLASAAAALTTVMLVTNAYGASVFWEPLTYFNPNTWQKADGYSNGGMFNCTWRANNVGFTSDGKLRLGLTSSAYNQFDCGEYRTTFKQGYGLYEVSMKPAKNVGIVSSFFTYTGPADGTPWDEIDIEFLGKDTTKVQFNYFTNGVGGHEKVVNLGFDAAAGFHTYAFDWQPGYIKWYVDGVLKHTATTNIPSHPGKIMMNIWNGTGVDSWLGAYNGANPLYAEYDWVKYTSN
ncbi:beta-glucanase [Paenibacillus aurantiacus]|uniref:beta-glucanase n=1 Tax=Paenibacillus aurantiacus TaxID=1936118 RepID=UPI00406BD199